MIPFLVLFSGTHTPWTVEPGHGAVGLFRPLTLGVAEKSDLTLNTPWVFVAPEVELKRTILESDHFALAAAGQLGMPTYGLRMLQTGFLQPIAGEQHVPFALVWGGEALAGWRSEKLVVSGRLETRVGIPFGENDLTYQDLPWLDPLLAPLVDGFSARFGARVDWMPSWGWLFSADGHVEFAGGPDFDGRLWALRALGQHFAVGVGIAGAFERTREGYPDWNPDTPKGPPAMWVNATPLFDFQGRW